MLYAEIAVNVPGIESHFDYHAPPELPLPLRPGHLVVVPFGRQAQVQGVVLRLKTESAIPETRPIQALLDEKPVLTERQIALARRLSELSLTPLPECIRLMLPPGLAQRVVTRYALTPAGQAMQESAHRARLGAVQQQVLRLLAQRGPLTGGQLGRALPRKRWQGALRGLQRRGLVSAESALPPPAVRPRTRKMVRLLPQVSPPQETSLGRTSATRQRRAAVLRVLEEAVLPLPASEVYLRTGARLADLRHLASLGQIALEERETLRDPLSGKELTPEAAPSLTPDQASLWEAIHPQIAAASQGETPAPLLLHGVTGSGKTELYLRAVAETLARGRQAIILVPEIALTPQTVERFLRRFPGQVGVVHSKLSAGERYDTWRRARDGALQVVVGPRSALFTPFPDVGLIVVDECHEASYYQAERPSYHARRLAVEYARLSRALCLLGSATPAVESFHRAQSGEWRYLRLPQRILGRAAAGGTLSTRRLPPVQVVDMRAELKSGNHSIFSRPLQTALEETLRRGEQAILFLNRRGTSTYVFCRDCGYTLRCPRCDTPLTYHGGQAALTCHHCGYRRRMPQRCPQCGSERIRQYGTGTEKVEAEAHRLFPQARTLRWDHDTTRRKGAHERILAQFAARRADVLIGTQMLAKGLDLPFVTLVGVVLADVGLNLPDYRAGERVFQVLTQVAGRAGRSARGGRVVLQTFDPAHYVIRAAARHDYAAFYRQEIEKRRQMGYPPFTRLVRLLYRHPDGQEARQAAETLAERLQKHIAAQDRRLTTLIGPVPCFFARLGGIHRWQIILRGPDPAAIIRPLLPLPQNWRVEVEPASLL